MKGFLMPFFFQNLKLVFKTLVSGLVRDSASKGAYHQAE